MPTPGWFSVLRSLGRAKHREEMPNQSLEQSRKTRVCWGTEAQGRQPCPQGFLVAAARAASNLLQEILIRGNEPGVNRLE